MYQHNDQMTNVENQKVVNEIRSRNANQMMMATRKKLQRALMHALLLTYTRKISINEHNITFKRIGKVKDLVKAENSKGIHIAKFLPIHTHNLPIVESKLQIHGTCQLFQASKP